jgi:tRNA nucleotidyltransferase/poly(A) polymerase
MKTFVQFVEAAHSTLENAKRIIKALRDAGFQAYLAGGAVRDSVMGMAPKDYDVATDAVPTDVLKMFPNADSVGQHFGVVIENGIEIATFRSDGSYGDGRRPDSVRYEKSFREDSSRRDFTINSLAMSPFSGEILDFHGGQEDIKNKIIRTVGDPHKRFGDDFLRLLRAVRFAVRFGFTIEPATLAAMTDQAHNIKHIAIERTSAELMKSLAHDPLKTVQIMDRTGMLSHVLPEVSGETAHDFALTQRILHLMKPPFSSEFALTALLVKVPVQAVLHLTKRLKLSNDEADHVVQALQLQDRISRFTLQTGMDATKKLMRERHFADALHLYGLREACGDVPATNFNYLTRLYASLTHEDLHPVRFVSGNDLLALGLKAGKKFKEILDDIENGQLDGSIKTREQAMELVRTKYF